MFATAAGGREWFAKWNNGHARTLGNQIDPDDPWFNTMDGEATYVIDGNGKCTASSSSGSGGVRMYVLDPAKSVEWKENLEITGVFTYISGGGQMQVFCHTNHGGGGVYPNFDEDAASSLCDDRGYGPSINYTDGWFFEKETCHHCDEGTNNCGDCKNKTSGYAQVSKTGDALSKNVRTFFKFIIRNNVANTQTKLDQFISLDGGKTWTLKNSFTDTGSNWGASDNACAPGVNSAMRLTRANMLPNSITGKPHLCVYFRTDDGDKAAWENLSIREIDPF
jgi:hypothetical protein